MKVDTSNDERKLGMYVYSEPPFYLCFISLIKSAKTVPESYLLYGKTIHTERERITRIILKIM